MDNNGQSQGVDVLGVEHHTHENPFHVLGNQDDSSVPPSLSFPASPQHDFQDEKTHASLHASRGKRYSPYADPRHLSQPHPNPRSPSRFSPHIESSPDQGQPSPNSYLPSGPIRGRARIKSDPFGITDNLIPDERRNRVLSQPELDNSFSFATPKSVGLNSLPHSSAPLDFSHIPPLPGTKEGTQSLLQEQKQSQPNPQDDSHAGPPVDSDQGRPNSSREGFRLIIPPDTLQQLQETNSKAQDEEVTVLLSPEAGNNTNSESILSAAAANGARMGTGGAAAANKQTTRPKHYKCSKCGQPKKGHVCEYAQDKPARVSKESPSSFPLTTFDPPNPALLPTQSPQSLSNGMANLEGAQGNMFQEALQGARQAGGPQMVGGFHTKGDAFQMPLQDMSSAACLPHPTALVQQVQQPPRSAVDPSLAHSSAASNRNPATIYSSFQAFEQDSHQGGQFFGMPPVGLDMNHQLGMSTFDPSHGNDDLPHHLHPLSHADPSLFDKGLRQ